MNRNIFTGIIILIIVAVAFFARPSKSEEHIWKMNDLAYVTHVCSSPEMLIASAILYSDPTPENLEEADAMFLQAMKLKTCVYNQQDFIVRLVDKIYTIQNLYGIDGYDGQVWSGNTVGPNGMTYRVYIGMLKKEFATKKSMQYAPGVNL